MTVEDAERVLRGGGEIELVGQVAYLAGADGALVGAVPMGVMVRLRARGLTAETTPAGRRCFRLPGDVPE